MYPKVKVREQREEAAQYVYEKSSLESLKAFEWLSLNHSSSSSEESPRSVVRIPRAYIPKSPPPSFYASKEEMNKKETAVEEWKNVRATSTPRPRAVLSSPVNDGKIGSKTETRKEVASGLKDHISCQNRHTQCKIFPRSTVAEHFAPSQGHKKETTQAHNSTRAKGRTALNDSSLTAGHRKRITIIPTPVWH